MADSRIYDVLEEILADVGGGGGTPLVDRVDALAGNELAVGVSTIPRQAAASNSAVTLSTGFFRTVHFTALRSFTSTGMRVYSGGTAAAATPTLVRFGLYSLDPDGAGTLIASIANDTSLLAATSTAYTRSWTTPAEVTAGARYALGALVVSAAAAPSLPGLQIMSAVTGSGGAAAGQAPRLAGSVGGTTDLPADFTDASLVTPLPAMFYAAILP